MTRVVYCLVPERIVIFDSLVVSFVSDEIRNEDSQQNIELCVICRSSLKSEI